VPKIQELKGVIASQKGWEVLFDSKSEKLKIEAKRTIRGLFCIRAMGVIDCPPNELFKSMYACKIRGEWDSSLCQIEYLQ